MSVSQVVVESTRVDLYVTVTDENDAVVNLTGGSAKLQGRCAQLPSVTVDVTMSLFDPAQGVVKYAQLPTLVTQANLDGIPSASVTFTFRVRFQDAAGLFSYTDEFSIEFFKKPTVL